MEKQPHRGRVTNRPRLAPAKRTGAITRRRNRIITRRNRQLVPRRNRLERAQNNQGGNRRTRNKCKFKKWKRHIWFR